MKSSAVLLLDDPLSQRLVLLWPVVFLRADADESYGDICSRFAGLIGCDVEQVMDRADALFALDILNRDGSVAPLAQTFIEKAAGLQLSALKIDANDQQWRPIDLGTLTDSAPPISFRPNTMTADKETNGEDDEDEYDE